MCSVGVLAHKCYKKIKWWKRKRNITKIGLYASQLAHNLVLPFSTLTSVLHLKDSRQSNEQTNNTHNSYNLVSRKELF